MTADQIIRDILQREGGYVNHPADRGGPTHFGITQDTLADWRGHPVTVADVQALTVDEATHIYRHRYLDAPGYLEAIDNDRLLGFVVDFAVHSGPGRATAALQRALGVTDDGVVGPQTRRLLASRSGDPDVFRRVFADRVKLLCRLAASDPSQRAFLDGWINRVCQFL
jgi:lysozyme family protein